jgi:tRNA-2-methylthio-N6-dimethylallyladenosine synthase
MTKELQGLRFAIRTFGCQMNESDSEHIAGILVRAGAAKAASAEDADIILVNTCAVRKKSEEKLDSFLGRLIALKKGRERTVVILGCVAQLHRKSLFAKRPVVDLVVGPDRYHEIPLLLSRRREGRVLATAWSRTWHEFGPSEILRESAVSAYVPIMEGCDNFCAYCVVPFTRGREKFRPKERVFEEIRDLAARGYKEVTFLGQNVNSYRDPGTGTDFAALLREASLIEGISWIRFVTSHPKDFSADIARVMAGRPNVCCQLHLPLQSGSTPILERMNRGYTRDAYMEKIALLKTLMPGISLSTDIIVGYPGETDHDFEETLGALTEIAFANIFSFRYSPRPRTAAAKLRDDVPLDVKRQRLIVLQSLQREIQLARNKSFVDRTIDVLCLDRGTGGPDRYSGRNEGYQVVNFSAPTDARGRFVPVLVTDCGPYSLHGRIRE